MSNINRESLIAKLKRQMSNYDHRMSKYEKRGMSKYKRQISNYKHQMSK